MNEAYNCDLDSLRKFASKGLLIFLGVQVLINTAVALFIGADWLVPAGTTVALAAVSMLFWKLYGSGLPTRLVIAGAVVGGVASLVAEASGLKWQPDLHMYFFVALAALTLYCDPRVILLATSAIALHHVILNFLLPEAVYPGGADLPRVVLHTIILGMEGGVLILLTHQLNRLFSDTAEKEAEIQLERAEAYRRDAVLAERNKMSALGQLAGGIAHELNNLLQPALTLPELVRDSLPPEEVEAREDLDLVLESVRQARDIVRNILTFSRNQDAQLETFDLANETTAALSFIREMLPMGVSLMQNIENSKMPAALNRTQLTQVLTNLILNSAYAIGDRGLIEVSVRRTELNISDLSRLGLGLRNKYLSVAVSDSGTGMDEPTKLRVFEPFFTTRAVGEGVGLGLSVVFGVIRSWNGTVSVESTLGKGSTFTLYIPEANGEVETYATSAIAA